MSQSPWQRAYGAAGEVEKSEPLSLQDIFSPPPEKTPEIDWERVWTLLTESRQSGLGEGPITEAWLNRPSQEAETPSDKRDEYASPPNLKKRFLSALEEQKKRVASLEEALNQKQSAQTPAVRFDLRHFDYFQKIGEARDKAVNALIDPYTHLLSELEDIDPAAPDFETSKTGAYAFAAGANLSRGRLNIVRWHLRGAEAALNKAARADAHDPDIWWHLGLVRLLRRKTKAAVKALQLALNYRPGDSRARIALGLAYYHDKDYANAAQYFDYEKGPDSLRTGTRSFLICSLRMQRKWDQARMEISRLAQSPTPAWQEMAAQCSRCVDRGSGLITEAKKRPYWELAKLGVIFGALFLWLISHLGEIGRLIENLGKLDLKAVIWPAIIVLAALAEHIKRAFGKKDSEEESFGDGAEDLPCWQTRTWMRPPRIDLFGQHTEISRK